VQRCGCIENRSQADGYVDAARSEWKMLSYHPCADAPLKTEKLYNKIVSTSKPVQNCRSTNANEMNSTHFRTDQVQRCRDDLRTVLACLMFAVDWRPYTFELQLFKMTCMEVCIKI
jgi:hypothetical protein